MSGTRPEVVASLEIRRVNGGTFDVEAHCWHPAGADTIPDLFRHSQECATAAEAVAVAAWCARAMAAALQGAWVAMVRGRSDGDDA